MTLTGRRRVLVTGATGTLGRKVVDVLDARGGIDVRVASRRRRPVDESAGREWRTVDLRSGPLEPLVEGCEIVVHLASGKGAGDDDVLATERLLRASDAAGVRHVAVVSIVGADRIPLPFYSSKRRIEAAVRASPVPWSIVRIAQFHSFVERLVAVPASLPVPQAIVADLRFQPVDEREAAEALADVALGAPRGLAPDVAGPEVLTLAEIAAIWEGETGRRGRLLAVPLDVVVESLAGSVARPAAVPAPADWALPVLVGYRAGENTAAGKKAVGRVTFAEWLRRRSEQRSSA